MDWTAINQGKTKSNAAVEKFLTNINMREEVNSVDGSELKNALLDCLVKHLRSRSIQSRTYQLLHDLVVVSEADLFSDDDLTRTFTLINSSLKVWEGNEYVASSCFEFLAALFAKSVTHDFPDFNELLVQNAFSFLERLRKSKVVVKAVTSFLEKIYAKCGDSVIHLPIASSIFPLLVDLLSQYGLDSSIAYICCQVISRLIRHDDEYVKAASYKITVVALSTLSGNHHNAKFVGLVLCILKDVIREEKHIEYLLGDEEEEFLYICRSISELKGIENVRAITAALEIIQRVVRSLFLRTLSENPTIIQAIGGAIEAARRHRPGCDGQCLQIEDEKENENGTDCSITETHVRLCDTIDQMFKTLKGYDTYAQQLNPDVVSDQSNDEETCGEILSQATVPITVNLISASDLINSDIVGVSDPYVIFSLSGESLTSKTINNDLNPTFNQSFSMQWRGNDVMHVEVWDFDALKPDDPIGNCDINLVELQLSGSVPVPLDLPLEGVDHGRIQIEIMLQNDVHLIDATESQEASDVNEILNSTTRTSDINLQQNSQDSIDVVQAIMPDTTLATANSEIDDEFVESLPTTEQLHTPQSNPKDALSPSYTSKAENDDVMMVMIRALQDEVEDWKQKYTELKKSHEELIHATEDTYNRSLSPEDIQFQSFGGLNKSQTDISPIKHDYEMPHNTTIDENDQNASNTNHPSPDDDESNHVSLDEPNHESDEDECVMSHPESRGFFSPVSATRKEGSDFAASITGMKSAFSFCMSPAEGRQIDVNELMKGDFSDRIIDHDIAADLYASLKWLFKHLRSIQSTNLEKMVLQMVLPRSLLRKFILDDFLLLLHPRRFQLRDLDIILHNVPSKLKFPDFVFVLVASASKRFAVKHNLSAVKTSVLSRLNTLVSAYSEEYQGSHQDSLLCDEPSHDNEQDLPPDNTAIVPPSIKIPAVLRDFGIKSLRKQDHVLRQIYFLYAGQRRDKRINFESMLMFAKDFNVCPGLISNSECFEMFEDVIRSHGKSFVLSKQPAINYPEFLSMLLEIAIVSNCFGEEDQLFQLTSQDNIWKKVLNFLWYLESSKSRTHIREKILLPNFKLDRKSFIVDDRMTDIKESTNLKLSILKFKY